MKKKTDEEKGGSVIIKKKKKRRNGKAKAGRKFVFIEERTGEWRKDKRKKK
jgi:hypothetical protein